MTEDVQMFVDRTLDIGIGLLNSVVTLASFVVILWGFDAAPLRLFGTDSKIPAIWSGAR